MPSKAQIAENYRTCIDERFEIFDSDRTMIGKNGEWFDNMSFGDGILLARQMTIGQMLEREDCGNHY
jgi:tyrosyl-tRNA synthetase